MWWSPAEPTLTPEERRLYRALAVERVFERYRRGMPLAALACVVVTIPSYFGPGARAPYVLMLGLGAVTTLLVSRQISHVPWLARRPSVLVFATSLTVAALIGFL